MMPDIYSKAKSVQVYLGESGVLDAIPQHEQVTWDEPPQIIWHRDATLMLASLDTDMVDTMDTGIRVRL